MNHSIPTIRIGVDDLLEQSAYENNALHFTSIGSVEWYAWLELQDSFSFESSCGTFVARKEQRYNGRCWYAYRRGYRKMRTAYLGKTEEITLDRLNEVARTLSSANTQSREKTPKVVSKQQFDPLSYNKYVLCTKYSIPSTPTHLVARPHLMRRLDEGIAGKLLLISAAAGSGKTTVLSEWVSQSKYPVAWVALDEQDNDPVRFWSYVIWSLETIYPGIAERTLALFRSSELRLMEAALVRLINSLSEMPHDFALVLDDYHILTTRSIHDAVIFLLNHLPSNMHLIIASRTEPPLPLARLRASGGLVELYNADLRFLPHEVRAFLTQRMGLPLSEEMLSILESHTEGWIAGLQLAALALQGQDSHNNFSEATSGSHRYILDYLVEEVLLQQSQHVQSFLLHTSILERLSEPLCNAVTEQNGSQKYLNQLERSNIFLFPLDGQRHQYRFHHLFKEALYSRLQNMQPDALPELYTRAYIWCEQNGLLPEAIQYAIAAGAFEQAARLVVYVGKTMIRQYEVITLLTWLDKVADKIASFPQLCLLRAWALTILERMEEAEQWLQKVECSFDEHVNQQPCTLFTECGDKLSPLDREGRDIVIQHLCGEVAAIRAHIVSRAGDTYSTIVYALKSLECLPTDSFYLRDLSTLNLGVAYWLQGDVNEAEQALMQACTPKGNSYTLLTATCALAQVQMAQGQRRRAAESSKLALKIVSEGCNSSLPIAAYAYIGMGQHYYEWNDLEAASHYFQQGIALSEEWQDKGLSLYGYTELAQVKHAQRDREGTLALVQKAEQYIQSGGGNSWIVNAMIAQQARLALAQGDVDKARRWMQHVEQKNLSTFKSIFDARLLIAQGQLDQALAIMDQQMPIVRTKGQIGLVIELHILAAMAYQRKNDPGTALSVLERALVLAEPEGYIRLFINEGEPMAILLAEALTARQRKSSASANCVSPAYVRKLLAALGTPADQAVHEPENRLPATCQSPYEDFSKREWEVIQLIVAGMSNKDIAQQLIVAETTVKWHIRNIFSKLNVRSRSQIIALARKLDW